MLTELRESLKADLMTAAAEPGAPAGVRAFTYVGETIETPAVVVIPAEPYLQGPSEADGIPFSRMGVNLDVLMLSARAEAKTAAALMDHLIEFTYAALNARVGLSVGAASRPVVVTVSGSKYVGSVLKIQLLTEEP